MKLLFIVVLIHICFVFKFIASEDEDDDVLVTLPDGELVRIVDDCTVDDSSTCPVGYCCTKKILTYDPSYTGQKPTHEYRCSPLRKHGEFCYRNTPENYCPCATRCRTNGFFGTCI